MDSDFSDLKGLKDINKVEIARKLTPAEKKNMYIEQVGNVSNHMVGEVEVECIFGNLKIDDMLKDLMM